MPAGRTLLAAIVLILGLEAASPAAGPPPQFPQAQRVGGFEPFQAWLRLARAHSIGQFDDAARQAATLSPLNQRQIIDDLQLVRLLVVEASRQGLVGKSDKPIVAVLRARRLSLDQLAPLLGLSSEETDGPLTAAAIAQPDSKARTAIAQIMLRAVLLHTDVALTPDDALPSAATSAARGIPTAVQLRDGRATAVVNAAQAQYAIAREAIALVMPATAGSEVARQWYLATIASLQGVRNYGALLPHLDTARVSLAGDWRVWLWSGAAQENLASPPVQVAAEEQAAKIESPWLLYTRAEQFYRRAMEVEPGCAQCWLRLARVQQLTNAADQSAALLARAEPKLETPELRYFAALFAGRAAEMLNRVPEARAAYERAMALFPRAQSPRLALAELAIRDAEQRQAQSGVRTMFVAAGAARDADPWWNYDIALVAKWPELVGQLRKMAFALLETK